MPFIDSSPVAGVFYNVMNSVGRNATNNKDDVRMVQYMLRIVYQLDDGFADGICGPDTRHTIVRFQTEMAGAPVERASPAFPGDPVVDGRIDRAKGSGLSTISHSTYTIILLNQRAKELNPSDWARIPFWCMMTAKGGLSPEDPEYPNARQGPALPNNPAVAWFDPGRRRAG